MRYAKGKRANLVNLGLLKPKKASSLSIHNKENRPEHFPFFSLNNILADFPAGAIQWSKEDLEEFQVDKKTEVRECCRTDSSESDSKRALGFC
jgi:hypothetical protein